MDPIQKPLRRRPTTAAKAPPMPRETTPARITPAIEQFCQHLATGNQPQFVEVRPASFAQINESLKNVQTAVEQEGGQVITGWLIWEIRGVLLNAVRHACWATTAGDLLDLTPKPDGETRILFLPEPTPWNGQRVCPRVEPLGHQAAIRNYVEAFRAEREQWTQGIVDFNLEHKLYEAAVELSNFLKANKGKHKKKRDPGL